MAISYAVALPAPTVRISSTLFNWKVIFQGYLAFDVSYNSMQANENTNNSSDLHFLI